MAWMRHLAILVGDILHGDAGTEVVVGDNLTELRGRIGRQVAERRFGLAEIGPAARLLQVNRLAARHDDLLGAVGAVGDLGAEALDDGEHLVDVGDGDATDRHELLAVGLEDYAPGFGLVDAVETFALGEHGDHALEHLSELGAIGQRTDEIDVADEVVVAGDADDGDRFDLAGGGRCGGRHSGRRFEGGLCEERPAREAGGDRDQRGTESKTTVSEEVFHE